VEADNADASCIMLKMITAIATTVAAEHLSHPNIAPHIISKSSWGAEERVDETNGAGEVLFNSSRAAPLSTIKR
jgi:hypothetical protein